MPTSSPKGPPGATRDTLITRYRPRTLSEFRYNPDVVALVRSLLAMDTLNVLFIGDSGTGKSCLVRAIIQEYYSGETGGDNVLTITNLRDQGISYYRTDVKTFCQTASTHPGRKKIVVLDDLDCIYEQSQQVFRNCMDKYSHNVLFLATCTNAQKVIDSIQSRLTLVRLRAFAAAELREMMECICTKESISIADDAADFTVAVCNNSIRTLINYLEKFILVDSHIDLATATTVCTNVSFSDFERYTALCRTSDGLQGAIAIVQSLVALGYSVMDVLDSYFLFVKATHTMSEDEKYRVIAIICKYITVFHDVHEDDIELAFLTNNIRTALQRRDSLPGSKPEHGPSPSPGRAATACQ